MRSNAAQASTTLAGELCWRVAGVAGSASGCAVMRVHSNAALPMDGDEERSSIRGGGRVGCMAAPPFPGLVLECVIQSQQLLGGNCQK